MKHYFSFVTLTLLSMTICVAQSATTERPNRRQALYDQYNSITRKPADGPMSPEPVASTPESNQVAKEPEGGTGPTMQLADDVAASNRRPVNMSQGGIRMGFRSGVTYPVFADNHPFSTPEFGFAGGITLTMGRGVIAFQPELNYARYSIRTNLGFGASTFATDKIEVPLFLRLATGTYIGNRFFLNIGPYASYATSASADGKKTDVSNTKGRLGFGAAAGVGTALRTGPGHITLEARGLYALGDTYTGFSTSTNTILGQVTLGYVFLLGSR